MSLRLLLVTQDANFLNFSKNTGKLFFKARDVGIELTAAFGKDKKGNIVIDNSKIEITKTGDEIIFEFSAYISSILLYY